jgi:acyl carrier protein
MTAIERLRATFRTALDLKDDDSDVDQLEYRSIEKWDSLGHMALIAALEDEFEVMIDTDDVIDMSSFTKAQQILAKNGISFSD